MKRILKVEINEKIFIFVAWQCVSLYAKNRNDAGNLKKLCW